MTTLALLYPGCLEFEVMLPIQLLGAAGPVIIATPDGADFVAASGLKIRADHSFQSVSLKGVRTVLIPGGDPKSVVGNEVANSLLKSAYDQGAILGAICAGPLLLGQAGLLRGKRVAHGYGPDQLAFLAEFFEGAQLTGEDVEEDGRIVTAKPQAFVEFALTLARLSGAIEDEGRLRQLLAFYKSRPET